MRSFQAAELFYRINPDEFEVDGHVYLRNLNKEHPDPSVVAIPVTSCSDNQGNVELYQPKGLVKVSWPTPGSSRAPGAPGTTAVGASPLALGFVVAHPSSLPLAYQLEPDYSAACHRRCTPRPMEIPSRMVRTRFPGCRR